MCPLPAGGAGVTELGPLPRLFPGRAVLALWPGRTGRLFLEKEARVGSPVPRARWVWQGGPRPQSIPRHRHPDCSDHLSQGSWGLRRVLGQGAWAQGPWPVSYMTQM